MIARYVVVTPLGTYNGKYVMDADDQIVKDMNEISKEICENGGYFCIKTAQNQTIHLPEEVLRKSIFIVEVK